MNESSSPTCYAGEGDPAYAGYMRDEELIQLLNVLLESERAGSKAIGHFRRQADGDSDALLGAVGQDEARYCAMLHGWIVRLGGEPSDKTGAFLEKAKRKAGTVERLAFLNRGQAWVADRLREALPKVRDDHLHADLKEMLETHEANIARTEALLRAG